jgi:acetyl esterase
MMPLLPATKKFIEIIKREGVANPIDWDDLTIDKYREMCGRYQMFSLPLKKNIKAQEYEIPVANNVKIPVKIFDVAGNEAKTKPGLIYIPGGGFITYLGCHDSACGIMAETADCRVIMIEPRLAPEYKAPIPVQDTCAAVKYIIDHTDQFLLDPERIALGGDSAGANLALCAALNFRDAKIQQDKALHVSHSIKQLILISGTYDLSMSKKDGTWDNIEAEDLFTPKLFDYMFDNYLGNMPRDDLSVSPYFRNLVDLPPVTLLVAEFDGVRHQTEALAKKFENEGVSIKKNVIVGQTHSYLLLRAAMGDGIDPAQVVGNAIFQRFKKSKIK